MLKVNEIFYSIQGESTHCGRPCVFIRLTGCNLRCRYCDTRYAYEEGQKMKLEAILEKTDYYNTKLVEITGGEPLIQKETPELCQQLLDKGYEVLVETNGTRSIRELPKKIRRILDIKCPGSGELEKIHWENFKYLRSGDEVKFVLSDIDDYLWAKTFLNEKHFRSNIPVLFSPVFGQLDPRNLANWILQDKLNVRLHLQIHKIIWPQEGRGR